MAGIEIFAFQPGQVAESNTFVGNNLTQFQASTADLVLHEHTRNTVAKGRFSTVMDLGSGNQITGASKVVHK